MQDSAYSEARGVSKYRAAEQKRTRKKRV